MQRLYSTFAGSWPGAALLLMRLGQAVQVVWGADWRAPLDAFELLTSGLLVLGLWTPLAGLLQGVLECRGLYGHGHFDRSHFAGVLFAACLAMLGPGAWSIDARLYGRQRIRIDRREE
jgi:putative oxidoreductase